MHRFRYAACLVAMISFGSGVPGATGAEDTVGRARTLLDRNDARAAVDLLEEALVTEPGQRASILELLREGYEQAAKAAERDGDQAASELYRDNLEIVSRKATRSKPTTSEPAPLDPQAAPTPAPGAEPTDAHPAKVEPTPLDPNEAPKPLEEPLSQKGDSESDELKPLPLLPVSPGADTGNPPPAEEQTVELPTVPATKASQPVVVEDTGQSSLPPEEKLPPLAPPRQESAPSNRASVAPTQNPGDSPTTEPAQAAPVAQAPTPTAEVTVELADAAFTSKQYGRAGQIYGELSRQGKLPKSRLDHLAYCRCAEVVRRINAKPTTSEEWKQIDEEIRQIKAMNPRNWYAEYLRNLASERATSQRTRPSQKFVVRGSSPDEHQAVPGKYQQPPQQQDTQAPLTPPPAGDSLALPEPVQSPGPGSLNTNASSSLERAGNSEIVTNWQVRESANFRIYHTDPKLAEQVVQVAEVAREDQIKRWWGPTANVAWSPRCDIYIYPTAKSFSRMTGQTEESPGFSTMGMNAGKIVTRRINLRADHPTLTHAVLPHEVTHVVLADLFPTQQVPRWADEGMAVLAEPESEQLLRAGDLKDPLTSGKLFKLKDLMIMDYPEGKYWGLYYAQSVSLTRFMVELGTPAQFIQFVQASQRGQLEAELKRIYKINSIEELQNRWLAYARDTSSSLTAGVMKPSDTIQR